MANDPRISCMLNTEVCKIIAEIRRHPVPGSGFETNPEESRLIRSLQSLRSFIFHPFRDTWSAVDPMIYLSPFLDVIQSEDVSAASTSISLRAVRKIISLDVFGELTVGAREAIQAVTFAVTNCQLELTDSITEDCVNVRGIEAITAVVRCKASVLLTDGEICGIVESCYHITHGSAACGDLFHDLIGVIYSRLPDMPEGERFGYGEKCMIDVLSFISSLLNVEEGGEGGELEEIGCGEEEKFFALLLINSVVEIGGESLNRHVGLMNIIQDEVFQHLIYYGTRSGLVVFSMICNVVFNLYHFSRRY